MLNNDSDSSLNAPLSTESPEAQKIFDRKRKRKLSPHKITINTESLEIPEFKTEPESSVMLSPNLPKLASDNGRSISDMVNSIMNKNGTNILPDIQKQTPLNILTPGNLLPPNSSIQFRDLNALVQFQSLIRQNNSGDLLNQTALQNNKFLQFMALQQQNLCPSVENPFTFIPEKEDSIINRSLIVNAMNLLMQSIPAPPHEVQNVPTINVAFNAVLVQALNFQQSVERYITQLQEGLAFSNYEKQVAACMAAAASVGVGTPSTLQSTATHLSDSSSSPNTSINESAPINGANCESSAVDLSMQEDGLAKSPLRSADPLSLVNATKSALTLQSLSRIKKYGGKRSSPYHIVNGVPVKKTNFRGTSEEENEVDPNFRPIELPGGLILLNEKYPGVTLPEDVYNSLIVKSSASATRLIRLLMKSFFTQEELAASSLSGEGIYKRRLQPNVTEAIKSFIRRRHPQLKTGSINLCMTDVCVQARRVSNNQRNRIQPISTNGYRDTSSTQSPPPLSTDLSGKNEEGLKASGPDSSFCETEEDEEYFQAQTEEPLSIADELPLDASIKTAAEIKAE